MTSGLYQTLVSKGLLIEHAEINTSTSSQNDYLIIQPEKVPFISYPYEWSFNQLKDAALTTLKIQKYAMEFGMVLKDASAYNIQFLYNIPKLIDILSFEFYKEGSPWIAYGQFCRHFLAPLFLMAKVDVRLSQLLKIYIDGIPLDLASKLLKGKGGFAAKQHIHWHARSISKHSKDGENSNKVKTIHISKFSYTALIESLIHCVENINLYDVTTEWMNYYSNTNYSDEAFLQKKNIISNFIKSENIDCVWDLGANDGTISHVALQSGANSIIAFDIDPIAVDNNYLKVKKSEEKILPLIVDLTNPSPGIGFANVERLPINLRQKPDCILALALIHHLAISNNLPFEKIAEWLSQLTKNLIIEFIPKEDSQVQTLLATRTDIFSKYNNLEFEKAFGKYFNLVKCEHITESSRIIYLYSAKEDK